MSNELSPEELISIKAKWIQIMKDFIELLWDIDKTLPCNEHPAFHCCELRK